MRAFDPIRILSLLMEREVAFVVIGGLAGRVWGSPTITNDLDICYARDTANLERLAGVLGEIHATLRGAPEGLPFQLDEGLRVRVCSLDDLLRMKRAAARPKDLIEVEILQAVRDERSRTR